MPAAAAPARVRDAREAVRHAPAARLCQFRGPPQQDPERLTGLRAQPLLFRPALFPQLSGLPVAFGLTAAPLFPLPAPPPGPRFLPPGGPADGLLRLRDHRLRGISGRGHARLVTQWGLPAGEEM